MSTTWQLQADWRRFGNWTENITRIALENGAYNGEYNNGVPLDDPSKSISNKLMI